MAMQHAGPLADELNALMAAWPPSRSEGINRLRNNLSAVGFYWPMVRLQLARALDAHGDREAAIEQYQRFARLWRDADVSLRSFADEATRRVVVMTQRQDVAVP